jgi:hypothetical protein
MITPDRVRQVLYDPYETGVLYWLIQMGCRGPINTVAGYVHTVRHEPRWTIQIDGSKYLRSRLVFVLYNGRWPMPGLSIDHIDKDTLNDSVANLREITHQENMETREPFRYWKQGLR